MTPTPVLLVAACDVVEDGVAPLHERIHVSVEPVGACVYICMCVRCQCKKCQNEHLYSRREVLSRETPSQTGDASGP